jgi:cell division protein FtsL
MRSTTLVIVLVAVAIGVGLFMVKYRVQDLEDQLVQINSEIAKDREAIQVLRAEWSHLNEPDRLRGLADKYLGMKPVPVGHVASRAAMDDKLPVRPKAPDVALENPGETDSRKEPSQ